MSVGQTLADARAERRLSIDDIAAATRIRGSLIREIEADDFSHCGGAVYARGHIRSIARFIGIDPEPLVAEFDRGHHIEAAVVPVPPPETDQVALAHTERRRPNWTAAMVAALVVVIAVAAYGLQHGTGHKPGGMPLAGATSTPPASPPATSTPLASPPPQAQAEVPPGETSMLVRAQQETWLQVTNAATGAVIFEDLLPAGQHKLFTSKSALDFVIGNAPGVDLVVNGKDLGSPKSSGNVARGEIQPGSDTIQQA